MSEKDIEDVKTIGLGWQVIESLKAKGLLNK